MMPLNTYVIKSAAIVIAVALSGCGGDSSSDTTPLPPPKPESKLLALDGFSTVKPDTKTRVNLSSFVRGDNVKIVSANVEGDNSQCGVPTVDGTSLDITAGNGAYCSYSYLAQSGDIQSYAQLRVLATDAVVPMLPPISQAMVLGGSNVSINLETLLGSDWPTGYQLNSSSIKVQGSEGNLGSAVSTTGNTIVYKGPELSGWNRLVYTISNPAKPGEDKMGTVYITVSEQINQPPAIAEPKYDYNKNNPSSQVTAGKTVVLDLNSLPNLGITEPDSQDWQLIDVQSYSATVAPSNPNSVTNKSFSFNAGTIGNHYVSYIIADHFGGYSSGLINISVGVQDKPSSWVSLTSADGLIFSAPERYLDATKQGYLVTPIEDVSVNNTIAGYNANAAQSYCSTIGGLPTESEFLQLRATHWNDDKSGLMNNWPHNTGLGSANYLVKNNNGESYQQVDIDTGVSSSYNEGPIYVTCVLSQNLKVETLTRLVVADGSMQKIAKITKPKAVDVLKPLEPVTGSTLTSEEADLSYTDNGKRIQYVVTRSRKAGVYQFRTGFTNGEQLNSAKITFIGDEKTASMANSTSIIELLKNNAAPDGVAKNEIRWRLTDENANPISKALTTVSVAPEDLDKIKFLDSSLITDSQGYAHTAITSNTPGDYTITVGYKESTKDQVISFADTTPSGELSSLTVRTLLSESAQKKLTIQQGETFKLCVTLKNKDGVLLTDRKDVTLLVNGNIEGGVEEKSGVYCKSISDSALEYENFGVQISGEPLVGSGMGNVHVDVVKTIQLWGIGWAHNSSLYGAFGTAPNIIPNIFTATAYIIVSDTNGNKLQEPISQYKELLQVRLGEADFWNSEDVIVDWSQVSHGYVKITLPFDQKTKWSQIAKSWVNNYNGIFKVESIQSVFPSFSNSYAAFRVGGDGYSSSMAIDKLIERDFGADKSYAMLLNSSYSTTGPTYINPVIKNTLPSWCLNYSCLPLK
ncbi:Ig-like domain-containing protein [Photobacterium damselae]|uniref:Ig-like domain-containing protein n=1 Tax=Photobacterium damselae TaxID=38293 RepID=UPI0040692080